MKFASFSTTSISKPHMGLVQDNEILDVDLAAHALTLIGPDQMIDYLEQREQHQLVLQAILDRVAGQRFSDVKIFNASGAVHPLSEVQLAAPIPRPRKNIMCLGRNYLEHAREWDTVQGKEAYVPTAAVIFTKAPTTVNSPYGEIVVDPHVSVQVDWETELAVIIGKTGKNIREEDALDYVFGYTVLNDVTARDLQDRHRQFFKGKSIDGYCPMGPWIVTADEIPDPQNLAVSCRVNGITKQDSNTAMMIFSVRQIIAILSLGMTLEPGDIIATGTPSGVGHARKPAEYLKPGDIMETEIAGIGLIRNQVV
ncbi:MAG TPA: fumarylacetoacetate hydrolase family protein [Ktedonobacteraceae bacterium]|nr:fumarylacetoacetate hydrolase family protein [Ktedonobacteraceae bacterium]